MAMIGHRCDWAELLSLTQKFTVNFNKQSGTLIQQVPTPFAGITGLYLTEAVSTTSSLLNTVI